MAEEREVWVIVRVVLLCTAWYLISSGNNVVGKTLLNEFPYPMTVTMVQLVCIATCSSPVLKWMKVRRRSDISWSYYKRIIIPLALGKFMASVFSHVSIWRVPVSYAHTVKATMPLFTVVLGRVILQEKQTTKVLTDTGIHHLRLLHLLGCLALFMFLPVWVFTDGLSIFQDESLLVRRDPWETLILLLLDGGLSWLQNLVAFTILHHVTPLTYAVASATKRISIISISLLLLRNPVTMPNVVGMFMAIVGVLGYNKAKYDANQSKKKAALMPLSQVVSTKHLNHSLQPPPFHPAYIFNHLEAAKQGPYPRLSNGTSSVVHTFPQNGHIPQIKTKNSHSVLHVSKANNNVETQ
ncbi:solute carrier family 35 member E1 homolog isoform X2 [Portunus trituberculatus]|uniref:solute carrier family 35 member E1 homolog isoform X2 n=1 Tax=Portunus trituberculatus TaxID=210409 RepID=UPI001E1D0E70|nr:solute carrier family 35 member E1 homolog isoform X2 [Portunus trituberculatus]